MAIKGKVMILIALAMVAAASPQAEHDVVHHVVGGDQGFDVGTDIASWVAGRIFAIGDKIWFMYSVADGYLVELKSKEAYLSCDFSNPIKMYTDGINGIDLDTAGVRYFASSNAKHCKAGLKLHVAVMPHANRVTVSEIAAGPSSSSSTFLSFSWVSAVTAFWVILVGF